MMAPLSHSLRRPLPLAIAFFSIFTLCQLISLPILITWDGHRYLYLTDLIGSGQFSRDWLLFRTPLFPLGLKLSFAVLGRNPYAAQAVPLAMGVLGCLLLASSVRRVAGDWAAAASLVLLALYPTLVAFEHAILTETGSFFFLALTLRLSLWMPETPRAAWRKALSQGLALGTGYYWRQTILLLVPWFALLHFLSARHLYKDRRGWTRVGLQAVVVALLPWVLIQPWSVHFGRERLSRVGAISLRTYAIRQALFPPDDARVAPAREEYRAAVDTMNREGFRSGIPESEMFRIAEKIAPPSPAEGTLRWFASLVGEYPGRYAAAVGRTLVFFTGFKGGEDAVKIYRDAVLSPANQTAVIGAGPPQSMEKTKQELAQSTGNGRLKAILWEIAAGFDWLLLVCNLLTVGMLAFAIVRRDYELLALSGTPTFFGLGQALLLMSINRYMVPAYPIAMACGLLSLFRLGGWLKESVRGRARA